MRQEFPSPQELKGALIGTWIYLAVYFFFLIPFQSFSKFILFEREKSLAKKEGRKSLSFRQIKYYNSKDMLALTGDRSVGNFLEFAILFLPLLWMRAVFVDPSYSLEICIFYSVTRAIYPMVYFSRRLQFLVFLSTGPGYILYTALLFDILLRGIM